MGFGPLGLPELLLIFIVALLVFGPKKLPEVGKTIGQALSMFRKASSDFQNTIKHELQVQDLKDLKLDSPPTATRSETAEREEYPNGHREYTELPDSEGPNGSRTGPQGPGSRGNDEEA